MGNCDSFTWLKKATSDTDFIVILSAGLNNKPEIMNPLGRFFGELGYAVLRVNLTGQYGDMSQRHQVSSETWIQDFITTLDEATHTLPHANIIMCGFSLGAAVALRALLFRPAIHVKACIFLAPAFKLTLFSELGRLAAPLGKYPISIVTGTPKAYRAWARPSLRAYRGLYQIVDSLNDDSIPKFYTNMPTLVIMDKRDRLVNYRKLQKWIKSNNFNSWSLLDFRPKYKVSGHNNHLMVDENVLGSQHWQILTFHIKDFLSCAI